MYVDVWGCIMKLCLPMVNICECGNSLDISSNLKNFLCYHHDKFLCKIKHLGQPCFWARNAWPIDVGILATPRTPRQWGLDIYPRTWGGHAVKRTLLSLPQVVTHQHELINPLSFRVAHMVSGARGMQKFMWAHVDCKCTSSGCAPGINTQSDLQVPTSMRTCA